MKAVTPDFVKRFYPVRDKWSHKGDSGRVLIIGGNVRYKGAPFLAGLAALRTGVDLVTIATPESAADIIAGFSPNIITEPMEGDYLNPGNVPKLLSMSKKADAVLIGNGMGRMAKSMEAALDFLKSCEKPCILDADALYMIVEYKKILKKGWIVTPHEHEFYNLSGVKLTRKIEERAAHASKFSQDYGATVLLKGHKCVIAEGREVYINSTGNAFMTVGGTGDVLAGICAALVAMRLGSINAAAVAAYLSGSAGDIAAKYMGPGLLATDVIERIPEAIKKISSFEELIR